MLTERQSRAATPRPASALAVLLVVVVVVATSSLLLFHHRIEPHERLVLAAVASGSWLLLLTPRLRWQLSMKVVLVAAGVMMVVAVVVPARESRDLWNYAMYGRIATVHDSSPYSKAPNRFPDDPALQRMAKGWRSTPSPYGPLFTAISGAVVQVTGTAALPTRLAFQGLAAVAVSIAALLLIRSGCSPGALSLLLLNPLVFVEVVNGGHNDALVGLALLGAVLVAIRRRPVAAGVLVALCALVKIVLLLPAAALAIWFLSRYGMRAAWRLSVATATTLVLGYLLAGGLDALGPLFDARQQMSRGSLWQLIRPGQLAHYLGSGPRAPADSKDLVSLLALVAVVIVASALVAAARARPTPVVAVAAATITFFVLGAYVLPWYVAWVLPVLVLELPTPPTRAAAVLSAVLLVGWQYRGAVPRDPAAPEMALWLLSSLLVALASAVALALLIRGAVRDSRRLGVARAPAPTDGAVSDVGRRHGR
jgi:alpha-1,6-mannosyltransferase